MAVYGSMVCHPLGQFSFPRAYATRVVFGFGAGAIITHTDGDFFVTDGTNPIVHVVARFKNNFWDYSSNGYSLDWILDDWWLLLDPSPTPIPLNLTIDFQYNETDFVWEIFLWISGWTTRYEFDLPGEWQPHT